MNIFFFAYRDPKEQFGTNEKLSWLGGKGGRGGGRAIARYVKIDPGVL